MEEKQGKGNTVLLTVLGIATLLVAVIGATFAYFSASGVSGNSATNNITATTATYGNTTVTFDTVGGYGTLNTGLIDLPQLEEAVDYSWLMKFKVNTSATTAQAMTVSWKDVANTFCQYQVGATNTCSAYTGTCMNGATDLTSPTVNSQATCQTAGGTWTANTFKGDELYYQLYSCTETAWGLSTAVNNETTHTVSVDAGCTLVSATPNPTAPISANTSKLHDATDLPLAAGGTNYYALVLSMKNLTTTQDYNQGKSFSGTVNVALVQNTVTP